MKKVSLLIAVIIMISAVFCGCGESEPIYGTWEMSYEDVGYTVTLSEGNTGIASAMGGFFSSEFTFTTDDGILTIIPAEGHKNILPFDSGEYKVRKDVLEVENEDYIFYFNRK